MNGSGFGKFIVSTLVMGGGAVAGVFKFGLLATVLIFAGVVGVLWIAVDGWWERHNDELYHRKNLVDSRTRFAATISTADKETRYFLAHEWPEMGVEFGEEHLTYILEDGVNTQVLVSFLRTFLQDSNETSFIDVRNYNDDKYLQERFEVSRDVVRLQWGLATDFLARKGYLMPDSMAGNRTWKWTSGLHYKKMMRRYANMREIAELK